MRATARTIVLERRAEIALDQAIEQWRGAELAWQVIEWGISHDPMIGPLLSPNSPLRGFRYPGARSIDEPDVDVLYEPRDNSSTIHDLTFREASSYNVGHG